MAMSLDAIFQPLNEHFLKLYGTSAGSPVTFRFDKFGSVISEQDFIDPNHPELGYSPGRAMERLSDLVNHIPADGGDGMSIVFQQDAIDSAYFYRMLSPAQPRVSAATDHAQDIIDAFSAIKANAVRVWENLRVESSSGLMLQYKPSIAEPTNWYDRSSDVWTQRSFSISSGAAAPEAPEAPDVAPPRPHLWRLKLDDSRLAAVLRSHRVVLPEPMRLSVAKVAALSPQAAVLQNNPGAIAASGDSVTPAAAAPLARTRMMAATFHSSKLGAASALQADTAATAMVQPQMLQPAFGLHEVLHQEFATIDIGNRFQLAQAIGSNAPQQPAVTDSITISFAYCLVMIRRPWYIDAFINDTSWFVPGTPKGAITSGPGGSGFPLLPIAFVAIKDLVIEANWAASDTDAAADASDFGPFKVTAGIVQNKLSHVGTQVIGWLVQAMPDLPPNSPPD